jgi:signal peptidase II
MQRKLVGSRVLEILERNRSAGISFLIALSVLLLDQVTKATVIVMFSLYESIPVMSYLNVGYWKNTGAAFSFLANADGWQRPLLILVGVAASYWLGRLILASQSTWIEKVAYAFILGGAMSNVFDRIFRGAVVDWIDLYWKSWHWPAFNVADMGITLGATIIILFAFVRVDGDRNGCSRARRSHHRGGA